MLNQVDKLLVEKKVRLVAVSKTKPPSAIMQLYNDGQRDFGENRVAELVEKYELLPKDIRWHMIGHLQSKKVKGLAPFISMIHSVDSIKLLREIQKQATRVDRQIDVLIQVKIGSEISKYGLTDVDHIDHFFEQVTSSSSHDFDQIRIRGLMGMASFVDDMEQVRREFRQLKIYFNYIQQQYFPRSSSFTELSMGMSSDYKIAIEEGSTMVRIGSLLFGAR